MTQPANRRKQKTLHRRRTANRQRGKNSPLVDGVFDSESRAHAGAKKKPTPLTIDDLFLQVPDHAWGPIPFCDATVPPGKLEEAKEKAIQAFTEWGVIVEASRASGLGRTTIYNLRRTDPVFHARMKAGLKNNNERIEREMRRRGQLPKGELAAIFVMKHNIRKYREIQRVELSGARGGPVLHADVKSELLKRLESIALKQKGVDVAVGEGPRLLKGSDDVEVREVKKVKQEGFGVRSRK